MRRISFADRKKNIMKKRVAELKSKKVYMATMPMSEFKRTPDDDGKILHRIFTQQGTIHDHYINVGKCLVREITLSIMAVNRSIQTIQHVKVKEGLNVFPKIAHEVKAGDAVEVQMVSFEPDRRREPATGHLMEDITIAWNFTENVTETIEAQEAE